MKSAFFSSKTESSLRALAFASNHFVFERLWLFFIWKSNLYSLTMAYHGIYLPIFIYLKLRQPWECPMPIPIIICSNFQSKTKTIEFYLCPFKMFIYFGLEFLKFASCIAMHLINIMLFFLLLFVFSRWIKGINSYIIDLFWVKISYIVII